jgi:hypothetical protein
LNIFLFSLYTDPCFELSELLRQHFVTAAVALHIPIGGTSGEKRWCCMVLNQKVALCGYLTIALYWESIETAINDSDFTFFLCYIHITAQVPHALVILQSNCSWFMFAFFKFSKGDGKLTGIDLLNEIKCILYPFLKKKYVIPICSKWHSILTITWINV